MSKRRHVLLPAAAAFLALAGCDGTATPDLPDLGPVGVIRDASDIVLPLDAYRVYDPQQIVALDLAQSMLASDCMGRFGFEWPVHERELFAPGPAHERRYGILDETAAARFGYRAPTDRTNKAAVEAYDDSHETDAGLAVLAGDVQVAPDGQQVPRGGCIGEARRLLMEGAPAANQDLVDELEAEAGARADEDSRVDAAMAKWGACMKQAGFDYRSSWEANDDDRWVGEVATQVEITTAVTDVRCKHSTNLVGIWVAVETAYQERSVEQHGEELRAYRELLDAQLSIATEVIAGRP